MEQVGGSISGIPQVNINTVPTHSARRWLKAGWDDLLAAPVPSLFFGVIFALAGYLIVIVAGPRPYLITAMTSGFFLVAPFLALGLYQISRRLESRERPTIGDAVTAWRAHFDSFGLFAAFLAFAFIFWERVSAILFALFHGRYLPEVEGFTGWLFLVGDQPGFLLLYLLLGAVVAAGVFAVSVVAVPMMLDRRVDVVTAAVTSVRAVLRNPAALLLWAGCIVALTMLGAMFLLVGLIFTMPLVGHASWHAYRDLVAPE